MRVITPLILFAHAIIILVIFWSGYSVYIRQDFSVFDENNILENLQALILLAVIAVYIMPIFQGHRTDKLLCLFFVWLAVVFFLREVDVDRLNVHAFLHQWGAGSGRNLLLGLGLACMVVLALMKLRFYFTLAKSFVSNAAGIMAMKAGALLLVGDLCEKLTFTHNIFYEEIFELIAYGVLLRAGSLLVQNEVSGISADSAENIGNSGFDR